jgi:hypothetical protein
VGSFSASYSKNQLAVCSESFGFGSSAAHDLDTLAANCDFRQAANCDCQLVASCSIPTSQELQEMDQPTFWLKVVITFILIKATNTQKNSAIKTNTHCDCFYLQTAHCHCHMVCSFALEIERKNTKGNQMLDVSC